MICSRCHCCWGELSSKSSKGLFESSMGPVIYLQSSSPYRWRWKLESWTQILLFGIYSKDLFAKFLAALSTRNSIWHELNFETAFAIELISTNHSDLTYFLSYATIFYATIFEYFDITAVIIGFAFAYKVKILVKLRSKWY